MFVDVVDEYDAFVDDVLCRRCIDVVNVDVIDVDCRCRYSTRCRYKLSMSCLLGENSRRGCKGIRASSCCSTLSVAGVAGEVGKEEMVAAMYES
jgi:hypothetical protein